MIKINRIFFLCIKKNFFFNSTKKVDENSVTAFLKHAPCMQKVQADYEVCSKKYQESIHELEKKNLTKSSMPVKLVCW